MDWSLRVEGSNLRSGGFDFLQGRWQVHHRKLCERLVGNRQWYEFPGTLEVAPILGGSGNFDHNELADPAGPYKAHSLRLYSSKDELWSVWWLDGQDPGAGLGPPVIGEFRGSKIELFGNDTFGARTIRVRTTYEHLDEDSAQWTQAFLDESGKWEVNWVMDFTRTAT